MIEGEIQFVLMFKINGHLFGFNVEDAIRVIRAIEIKKIPTDRHLLQGMIVVEEEIIPVFNLRKKLLLPEREISPDDFIILFKLHAGKGAIIVDSVEGTEYIFRDEGTGNLKDTDELLIFKSLSMHDENLLFIPEPNKFMNSSEYINLMHEMEQYTRGKE